MLNINVLYIYPEIIEINKEINLFRIIDNNIKESIVVYCIKEKDNYKVVMINTMSGETNEIFNVKNIDELDILINKFKILEKEIIPMNNLEKIKKCILNSLSN
ncbi:MAG TPA: hypothetical protein VLM92_15005 [Romboutsia sp.]|nr:hypothetical protein [Romboutsia sp.]HSQ90099.1 hypothetical protein [Romboutsia sp.]